MIIAPGHRCGLGFTRSTGHDGRGAVQLVTALLCIFLALCIFLCDAYFPRCRASAGIVQRGDLRVARAANSFVRAVGHVFNRHSWWTSKDYSWSAVARSLRHRAGAVFIPASKHRRFSSPAG